MAKYTRGPRSQLHVGGGLPAELLQRLEIATDKTANPYAPSKSAVIQRGIELALQELDVLPIQIANELAAARGIKASFGAVHYASSTPEGVVWEEAVRIASILRK